jgi:hypothetical protein
VPKVTILLSHERSGSHLLGEFIGKLRNVEMIDEVGNPHAMDPAKSRESFYAFKHDYIAKNPDLLLRPDATKHNIFVAAYFDHLRSLRPRKEGIVVDIKYSHVHMFENTWWPIFERPFLFKIAEERGIRILHLYRYNVVEATGSSMIADIRKIWHSWQNQSDRPLPKSIALRPELLVKKARLLEFQNRWFHSDYIGKCHRMKVTYEQLKAELDVEKSLGKEIARFVGGSLEGSFAPRHQKVTPPLADIVSNWNEVRAVCIAAGLGKYVKVTPTK